MPQKRSQSKPRNAIVVLGAHRSGTSALGGVLARLGCDLPNALMEANEFNPKGYYESLKIYTMNDALLASGGSSWDDWQQFNLDWMDTPRADEFLVRGKGVLEEEYGSSPFFLVKDPRICRLMPFWGRLFTDQNIEPIYILTHRNPLDVTKSLQSREGWPVSYGMLLWLRHVLDAESGSRGARRCFTSYDRLLDDWGSVVTNIQDRTDLTFPRMSDSVRLEIDDFLTTKLRKSFSPAGMLKSNSLASGWVLEVFKVLERWADTGEEEADFSSLDTIRAELNATAPIFGRLAQEAQGATQSLTAYKASQEKLVKSEHENAELSRSLDVKVIELADLEKAYLKRDEENQQIQSELAQRLEIERKSLEAERSRIKSLESERSQIKTDARLLRARQQKEFEKNLKAALITSRTQADKRLDNLRNEKDRVVAELKKIRNAKNQHDKKQLEQIKNLRAKNLALMNSTSWKMTDPLRRLISVFRR